VKKGLLLHQFILIVVVVQLVCLIEYNTLVVRNEKKTITFLGVVATTLEQQGSLTM
jgi:hypothetical protein